MKIVNLPLSSADAVRAVVAPPLVTLVLALWVYPAVADDGELVLGVTEEALQEFLEASVEDDLEEGLDEVVEEVVEETVEDAVEENVAELVLGVTEEALQEFLEQTVDDQLEEGVDEAVEDVVEDAVADAVEDSVNEAVADTVEETLEDAIGENVEDLIDSNIEGVVEETIEDTLEDGVEEALDDALEDNVEEYVEESVEETVEESVAEAVEDTVEESVATAVEDSVEASAEEAVESAVEESVAASVEESVEQQAEDAVAGSVEDSLEAGIEDDLEVALESDIESELEEQVEEQVEASVAAVVEDTVQRSVEESVEEEVESGVEERLEESLETVVEADVESSFEDNIADRVEDRIESQLEGKLESDDLLLRTDQWLVMAEPEVFEELADEGYIFDTITELPGMGLQLAEVAAPASFDITRIREGVLDVVGKDRAEVDLNHIYTAGSPMESVADGLSPTAAMAFPDDMATLPLRIGMLDSQVDQNHPALSTRRIESRNFTAQKSALPNFHGTAIASILTADDGNFAGLVPRASLYAASVFEHDRERGEIASTISLVRALDWLLTEGVDVVNISLAGPPNRLLERALQRAADRDVMLIAAAGNGGPAAAPMYPAAYDAVVAVTAVTASGDVFRLANRGDYLDLAAPGVDLRHARPGGGYAASSGTSFAVPFAVAAAARLRHLQPEADSMELLFAGAKDVGPPGRDPIYGYGLLRP